MRVAAVDQVADRAGDFAWQVIGSVVRRRNHTGRVPYPGSDPAFGWQGWIDRLPGERAPERGYVSTANARPEHPLASAISTDFVPPWRHGRIAGLLEGMGEVTPADMAKMHLDARDTFAEALLPRMLQGVEGTTPEARQCHDLLAGHCSGGDFLAVIGCDFIAGFEVFVCSEI